MLTPDKPAARVARPQGERLRGPGGQVAQRLDIGRQQKHIQADVAEQRTRDGRAGVIRHDIRRHASPRHVPARIVQVSDIPRTKNGKVVELAVRSVVHGMPVAHTDALANPEALELFKDLPELAT